MKPDYHFYNNTKFALQGFLAMFKSEKSFRIELFICLPLMIISCFVPCSVVEHILLISSMIFIFFAEALNSGIEAVVDLVSPEFHELAGKAKDCASAGVFCSISIAVVCWVLILANAFIFT